MEKTKTIYKTSTCNLLTIAFIVLKLTGTINWSWWWVLAPTWIPIAVAFVAVIIFVISVFAIKNNDDDED